MDQSYWQDFRSKVKRVALNSDYSTHSLQDFPYDLIKNREPLSKSPIIPNMVKKMALSSLNEINSPPPRIKLPSPNLISQMDQMQILNEKLRKIEKQHQYTNDYLLPNIITPNLNKSALLQSNNPLAEREKKEKEKLLDQILTNKHLFQDEFQNPVKLLMSKFNDFLNQEWHPSTTANKERDKDKDKEKDAKEEEEKKKEKEDDKEKDKERKEDDKKDIMNTTKFKEYTNKLRAIEQSMLEKLNKMEEEQNETLMKLKYVIMLDKQNRFPSNSLKQSNINEMSYNPRTMINNNVPNRMNILRNTIGNNNIQRRDPMLFHFKKEQFLKEIAQLIDRKLKESKEEEQDERKNTAMSLPHLPTVRNPFKQSLPTPPRIIKLKL